MLYLRIINKETLKNTTMKTRKEIMTEAHKIAKTLEGNYTAKLKEALSIAWAKKDNLIDVELKGKVKFGATKKQYEYLNSFSNVEISVFQNRFCNMLTKQKASELIGLAKKNIKINIY